VTYRLLEAWIADMDGPPGADVGLAHTVAVQPPREPPIPRS